ncbi:hypothetical protein [Tessaracoccus coleopterorum]|uniref:hypothetical protein n=1 Tax=Tessaracoccus coleopterorum TaxID=2714950 RepID=UPI001E318F95|nr:hypothetical protein [Tessaracoccus coleopterorum]
MDGRPLRVWDESMTSSWMRAKQCNSSSAAPTLTACALLPGCPTPPAATQPSAPSGAEELAGSRCELANQVEDRVGVQYAGSRVHGAGQLAPLTGQAVEGSRDQVEHARQGLSLARSGWPRD